MGVLQGLVIVTVSVLIAVYFRPVMSTNSTALPQDNGTLPVLTNGSNDTATASDNETLPFPATGGLQDTSGCPTLTNVSYSCEPRRASYHFELSAPYEEFPVHYIVSGGLYVNISGPHYNSTPETLTVYLDEIQGGDSFNFRLEWPYPQCKQKYSGRYEDGRLSMDGDIKVGLIEDVCGKLSMDGGIKVVLIEDDECGVVSAATSHHHWWTVPIAIGIYLCMTWCI